MSLPNIGVKATVGGLSGFQRDMGQVNNLVRLAGTAFTGFAAASAAAFAVLMDGVSQVEQVNSALAKMSVQTGIARSELGPFRSQMEKLFASGLVDSWQQAADNVQKAATELRGLSVGTAAMDDFLKSSAAVEKGFGTTVDSVIGGTKAMIEKFPVLTKTWATTADQLAGKTPKITTSYKTAQEALDLLVRTSQESHIPLEEINSIVEMYGSSFAAAGFSAEEFAGLLVKADDAAVSNFRVLNTAVTTFQKQVGHPSSAYLSAMRQLGLNGVVTDVKRNKITVATAMDEVFQKISTIKDPILQNRLAMQLFGTSIDKAISAQQLGQLAGFSDALNNVDGAALRAAATMEDDGTLGTAIHKFGAQLQLTTERLAQAAYQWVGSLDITGAINRMANGINEAKDRIVSGFQQIGSEVGRVWNDLWSSGGNINTAITTWINTQAGYIRDSAQKIADGFGQIGSFVSARWNEFFGDGGTLGAAVSNAINGVEGIINGAISVIEGAINSIISGAQGIWSNFFGSTGILQALVSDAWPAVVGVIQGAWGQVKGAFQSIIDGVSATWNDWFGSGGKIVNAVNDALSGLVSAVGSFVGAVGEVFAAIASAASGALQPILDTINKIINAIASLGGGGGIVGAGTVSTDVGASVPGSASGGILPEGISAVGERGMELVYKAGNSVQVIPISQGAANSIQTTNNTSNNRSLTVNMHGVKNGKDAIGRFAMMYATRRV